MPLLPFDAAERVRDLIPPARAAGHTAFAHAVLDGWLPGMVFVDKAGHPGSALICPENGFLIAVGRADAAMAHEAFAVLQRELLRVQCEDRLVVATTVEWDQALARMLPARGVRKEFQFRPAGDAGPPLPPGYRLEPVSERTAHLFGNGIDPWVVRTLGGPAAFAERSFGTVVLDDAGGLASACVACGIGGGEAEIEIGTAPWHRRRGLAQVAAHGFIVQSRARSLEPAWTCAADNSASVATALRLGFVFTRDVGVFSLDPRLVRRGDRWLFVTGL